MTLASIGPLDVSEANNAEASKTWGLLTTRWVWTRQLWRRGRRESVSPPQCDAIVPLARLLGLSLVAECGAPLPLTDDSKRFTTNGHVMLEAEPIAVKKHSLMERFEEEPVYSVMHAMVLIICIIIHTLFHFTCSRSLSEPRWTW